MAITLETTVKEAVSSSPQAPEIFRKRGIDPAVKCSGMYDMVTLEDAVEWCKIGELASLITELNRAIAQND